MNSASAKRIDIISTPTAIYRLRSWMSLRAQTDHPRRRPLRQRWTTSTYAPSPPCGPILGNNDYYRDYGPDVDRLCTFLPTKAPKLAVAHYREDLPVGSVDVAINGHPRNQRSPSGPLLSPQPGQRQLPQGHPRPHHGQNASKKTAKILSVKFIDLTNRNKTGMQMRPRFHLSQRQSFGKHP